MEIGKYNLENEVKAQDAVTEVGNKDNVKLLAAYDKRGGVIRLEGVPVPLGTFWDFNKKEIRKPDAKLKAFWKGVKEVKVGGAKKAKKVGKAKKVKEEKKEEVA